MHAQRSPLCFAVLAVILIPMAATTAAWAGERPGTATAEVSGEKMPVIPRLEAGPKIDGDLSEAVWKKAAVFKLGYADAGRAGEPDSPTTVRVLTDAENLYFGFDCVEKHPKGPFIPKGPMQKKEKRIPDHIRVQLSFGRWGRAAWYVFRTSPTEQPWMGGSVYTAPVDYNDCHAFNSRRGRPSSALKPPSYRAKARVLEGRWTAEISVKLTELALYPADGIPDMVEFNVFRVRVGEDRGKFEKMLVWDEGPCAWKGFWPHVQTWKRMSRPDRFQVDHGGAFWDSIQPLWADVVKLEAGGLKCRTVRRAETLPDCFFDKRRHYTCFGYTREEGKNLRLEWWADSMPVRPEWKATRVAPAAPTGVRRAAEFAKKPTAVRAGGKVRISFVVKEPVDVAVAIVDGSGRVIRHLAAGLLGKNAPAPLKPGLAQKLVWDGKDDNGKPVPTGTCKARVSLGLRPEFDYIFKDARGAEVDVGASKIAPCVGLGKLEPVKWRFHPHGGFAMQICTDPVNREVIIGGRSVFDGKTGKHLREVKLADLKRFPSKKTAGELCVDPRGNRWVTVHNGLRRYKPDGSPLAFEALGSHVVPQVMLGHANPNRGLSFGGPSGDCYVVHHHDWRWNWGGVVTRIGSDGRVKQWGLVDCRFPIAGVKADRAGNVYVACVARPRDQMIPKDFCRAPTDETRAFYGPLYGSIVKFPPSGGSVLPDEGGDMAVCRWYRFGKKPQTQRCRITGAKWVRPGFSVITARAGPCRCNCATGRFDLDPYGRLWIPDAIRSRIDVVDASGNTILVIGKHGKLGASKGTEIRWAYPKMVAVSDQGCYVADFQHRRALKLKLNYRVREEIALDP